MIKSHLKFYQALHFMKNIQNENEIVIQGSQNGDGISKPKRKYVLEN